MTESSGIKRGGSMWKLWCATVLMLASFAPVGQAQSAAETSTAAVVAVHVPEPSSSGLLALDLLFFGTLFLVFRRWPSDGK
jgi:hypothetical protein